MINEVWRQFRERLHHGGGGTPCALCRYRDGWGVARDGHARIARGRYADRRRPDPTEAEVVAALLMVGTISPGILDGNADE